ncbi:MAG: autotransporter outer membrane beta-barrel domain-containing protein [Moraxellaceae bacterium]|nr:autotransporter outer membrane beta-barrel domain-containing protein [Moraxellaceae bacterium]
MNGTPQSFGAIGGGKYRTETGSYIDVTSINALAGVGKGFQNQQGKAHLGVYVEFGKGEYDSVNDFENAPTVKADGDGKYYGVGVLARQTFTNNAYLEGGLRFGKTKTTYNSSDLQSATNSKVSFDSERNYMGANVGVGGQVALNDKVAFIPSASLIYSKYGETSETIAGSPFKFDAVQSLRSRFGGQFDYKVNAKNTLYSAIAWEREYKGDAKGSVQGVDLPSPSVKGDTGIVEVGTNLTPNKNLQIKLGATGAFGDRKGAGANVAIKYEF